MEKEPTGLGLAQERNGKIEEPSANSPRAFSTAVKARRGLRAGQGRHHLSTNHSDDEQGTEGKKEQEKRLCSFVTLVRSPAMVQQQQQGSEGRQQRRWPCRFVGEIQQ
jgi:hypothetical protein